MIRPECYKSPLALLALAAFLAFFLADLAAAVSSSGLTAGRFSGKLSSFVRPSREPSIDIKPAASCILREGSPSQSSAGFRVRRVFGKAAERSGSTGAGPRAAEI